MYLNSHCTIIYHNQDMNVNKKFTDRAMYIEDEVCDITHPCEKMSAFCLK